MTLWGGGAVNSWNELVWQSATAATIYNLWGSTEDLQLSIQKNVVETIVGTTTINKNFSKSIFETIDFSSTVGKIIGRQITNNMGIDSEMNLTKINDDIWKYVYPGETTNAAERVVTSFVTVTTAEL